MQSLTSRSQDSDVQASYGLRSVIEKNYKEIPNPGFQSIHRSFVSNTTTNTIGSSAQQRFAASQTTGRKAILSSFRTAGQNSAPMFLKDSCIDSSFTRLVSIRNNFVYFASVTPVSDDGTLIAGGSYDSTGLHASWHTNGYVAKTDNNGQVQWIKEFADRNKQDTIYTLYTVRTFELSNHDIIAVGYLFLGDNNEEHYSPVLFKLDAKGNVLWYKCYNTQLANNRDFANTFEIKGLAEGLNGDIILCGSTYSNFIGTRYQTVARLDKNGNTIWDSNLLS